MAQMRGFWRGLEMEAGCLLPDVGFFHQLVGSEDCAAQQRCVSPNIYRFREGRWVIAD